jgi:predicted SprT family Zn-dependent metalloprotease
MLSKSRVLQTIREGKSRLDIRDVIFDVEYAQKPKGAGKRAEIIIHSERRARIVLYPDATLFSVRHELCHMKLFKMGIPLTNTSRDLKLFPKEEDYLRMVLIVEWYINELQRRVFHEYYAVDEAGTPRPPPLNGLPKLPEGNFAQGQVKLLAETAKKAGSAIY